MRARITGVLQQRKKSICSRAAAIRRDGRLAEFVTHRYRSWNGGIGEKIEKQQVGFRELAAYALKLGEVTTNESGRQEYLENLFNEFIR